MSKDNSKDFWEDFEQEMEGQDKVDKVEKVEDVVKYAVDSEAKRLRKIFDFWNDLTPYEQTRIRQMCNYFYMMDESDGNKEPKLDSYYIIDRNGNPIGRVKYEFGNFSDEYIAQVKKQEEQALEELYVMLDDLGIPRDSIKVKEVDGVKMFKIQADTNEEMTSLSNRLKNHVENCLTGENGPNAQVVDDADLLEHLTKDHNRTLH